MAFAKDSFVKVEIYRDMKGKHLNFSFEMCFSASFLTTHTQNNFYSITYHENNVKSAIKTYPIIALHEHWAIFHML